MQNLQHCFLLVFLFWFGVFLNFGKKTADADTNSLQRLDPFFEVLQAYNPSNPGVSLMDVLILYDRIRPIK